MSSTCYIMIVLEHDPIHILRAQRISLFSSKDPSVGIALPLYEIKGDSFQDAQNKAIEVLDRIPEGHIFHQLWRFSRPITTGTRDEVLAVLRREQERSQVVAKADESVRALFRRSTFAGDL